MSGLNLSTGLSGSVVGGLYGPGSSSVAPTRTAVPEGPTTIAQAAYGGAGGGDGGGSNSGVHACVIGGLSIAILFFMWWSLPR